MKQLPKLVLFDLDDTLSDHQHSRRCGLLALQNEYPTLAEVPIEALIAEHERLLTAGYDKVLDGKVSLENSRLERFRRLLAKFDAQLELLEIEQAVENYRIAYEAHRRAVPGAVPLLTYFKPRVRIGVVTNGLTKTQQEKIKLCGLEDYVDFLLTSEKTGVKKPEERIFQLALEIGKASRDEAVFVGDSWQSDIVGASRFGIRCVWLNRQNEPCPDAGLTTELDSIEPLEKTLEALCM